ncbi:MAG: M23 family metallopeptidase [Treponema sp.]|nr:M23 family metallopeptidase [Treponema sp.]
MNKRLRLAVCLFLLLTIPAVSFAQGFPRIPELSSRDVVFKQYQDEIQSNNKAIASAKTPWLNFYAYVAKEDDTLLTLAPRCSLLYDTIATLNGISSMQESLSGKTLLLPTMQGLFIPADPQSTIEILVAEQHALSITDTTVTLTLSGRKFYFLPDERFSSTERLFFLDSAFRLPLAHSVLTSQYGMRVSPISGAWKFHNGIDMAAPVGTAVFACKSGTVLRILKNDPIYGNCITISHDGNLTSIYAHLDTVAVKKGDTVRAGDSIGTVGVTGATTGPHLHFELRQNGDSVDPYSYIPTLPK